jgi:tRNA (guanine37-N1)-methyltransferase
VTTPRPTGPVIRATPDLAEPLSALAAATFGAACPPGTTQANIDAFVAEHLSADAFRAWIADPAVAVLTAVDPAGLPVGYVVVLDGEPDAAHTEETALITLHPTCELSKCYVAAEQRGSGLARRLVAAALTRAARQGRRGMWLGTNGENARAQHFYRKMGFKELGPRHFRVGAVVHEDLVMERAIGDGAALGG